MSLKEFYSTGETSRLLGISRATVTRKFDAGILDGNKNPITGERLINRESIVKFMEKYNLNIDALNLITKKNLVLICSKDRYLKNLIEQAFPSDELIKFIITDSIYDALLLLNNNYPEYFGNFSTFSR